MVRALHVSCCPSRFLLEFFFITLFTMSVSSWDDGLVLECAARGPGSAAEFHAGWEGWLEGAHLAQLASDEDNAIRVAVLCTGRNGFLVLVEEGDFPRMGPWHRDGWVMIIHVNITLVPWFIWTPSTSGSSILWGFLVLIWGIRAVLFTTIRREGIVAGWMPVTGGYFVAPSCFLRSPFSRAWRASSVGLQGWFLIYLIGLLVLGLLQVMGLVHACR